MEQVTEQLVRSKMRQTLDIYRDYLKNYSDFLQSGRNRVPHGICEKNALINRLSEAWETEKEDFKMLRNLLDKQQKMLLKREFHYEKVLIEREYKL